jgi:chaperonin GroES
MSTKSFACLLATLLAYSANSLSSPLSDPSAARAINQNAGKKYGGGGGVGRYNLDDLAGQAGAWQTHYDMVLVERIQGKPKSESGLFIPDEDLPRLHLGRVMSVGPGREEENGSIAIIPNEIQVGSIIIAKNPWGIGPKDEETADGMKLSFMRSQDIAAVITGGLGPE